MRVVAGRHRGRRLQTPPGTDTRPTADRVKEALFSALVSRGALHGETDVLDLFAGSGALGIEALSRGARSAVFVDHAAAAVAAVRANLASLHEEARVVRSEALRFLGNAREERREYSLVFLDPPYRQADALGAVLSETLPAVLTQGAVVVSESDRRTPLALTTLTLDDERRYGDTLIRLHITP